MMVLLVWLTPPRSNSFKPSHCPPTSLPSPRLQRLSFLTTWRCSSWLWCLLKRAICWSMNQCYTTIRLIGSWLTNTIFLLLIPQRCVLSMLMISADEVASSTAQFFSFGDAEVLLRSIIMTNNNAKWSINSPTSQRYTALSFLIC